MRCYSLNWLSIDNINSFVSADIYQGLIVTDMLDFSAHILIVVSSYAWFSPTLYRYSCRHVHFVHSNCCQKCWIEAQTLNHVSCCPWNIQTVWESRLVYKCLIFWFSECLSWINLLLKWILFPLESSVNAISRIIICFFLIFFQFAVISDATRRTRAVCYKTCMFAIFAIVHLIIDTWQHWVSR